ncbi:MAG: dihydropteroate synthase [Oscillospiraceae bacterium]|jgi:5-methyltetrahydrofolate corrinoid/iron sulfur protein methyltransferase|nr:dihydropteroate synthase [Oscillospiraceae bacterium]
MGKFIIIGERIHCISPVIKKAMAERDPEPIIKRAQEQLAAGATYLDVNIGPQEKGGEELMQWAVQTIQGACDNVPLCLDTSNKRAIEAGIAVYNRTKGKPIVNSADAGDRIENIDLAAANDAIVLALCSKEGISADNDERMGYCQELLERGMGLGMDPEDLWFDPLFLVIKGMQDKQLEVLDFIRQLSDMGLNSTGGLSNCSNMMPKELRPIMDGVVMAMAMYAGLTSAIANPCDRRLMEAVRSADVIKGNTLYADSYLDL